jgi:chemotaxis protein methyltransferase CheR
MTPTPQSPDKLLGDPLYSCLKEHLIEATGLAYYADKDIDLVRRVRRRLAIIGFEDCGSYLELLRDPIRGRSEMEALIEQVTIGETYFFRHREHFEALRDLVLPDLINRNEEKRNLRIWCAGCADGAEPYSLSILLRRQLAHLLFGWKVSILATDINRQSLEAASEGRFEDWSLRSIPEDFKGTCFERKTKHWNIKPEYKVGISFQVHNLVESAFPPDFSEASEFDLIICRNVMIYFGPERMRKIVQAFHGCLAPGAWLLVGPTEPNMTCFTTFRVVNAPGVTLYQRPAVPVADVAELVTYTDRPLPPVPLPMVPAANDTEAPTLGPTAASATPTLADLRRRVDQGDWENAARCSQELIESDNLNALVHFHYALVLEQMGNYSGSEQSFRKAIYLDRQAVLAHYHLGLLLESRGDWRQAERCFNNTLTLLASRPGDEIVTDADGITADELRSLAHMQIENLRLRA